MVLADLPPDLESEILSRVPATYLKKLQTTCKRWYALFRDPRFVKKNLDLAETHVIFDDRRVYSVTEINTLIHSINLRGIQNSFDGVQGKLNTLKDSEQDKIYDIISHCDGLLLCSTMEFSRLLVWNPCTGQTRLIQANNRKRWYALFRDPRFVKKNFGKAAEQVILKDYRGYSAAVMDTLIHRFDLHGIQNSFDPSIEVAVKLNKLKDSEQFKLYSILIHCEGLLLCTAKGLKLVVWNPCTGQTRWIKSNDRNLLFDRYVLGYVNNNNKSWDSYRILTFDYFYSCLKASPLKFDIYEFNSDSWRFLDDVYPNSFIPSDGVTLKGNAYWYASDEEDPLVKLILKFDFTTERFERLCLPLSFKSTSYVNVVLSVVREGKLALLQQRVDDTDSLKMDIWVTKTKIDEAKDLSWSNFLVVDLGKVMLPDVMVSHMSFLVDEKNKMVVCCDTDLLRSIDPVRTTTKFYFAIGD